MSCDDNDFEDDDLRHHTKWAILVCPQQERWIVARVTPGSQIGEYEADMSKDGKDWRIAAFFDKNVEESINAMTVIGGNSIESNEKIADLLSGVIRSHVEAMNRLATWPTEKSEQK